MLRAMTIPAALWLLANTTTNASEELRREYREHYRRSRGGGDHGKPRSV
jgi:hypothetical protein